MPRPLWLARDAAGHLAAFSAGQAGAIPRGLRPQDTLTAAELLARLRARPTQTPRASLRGSFEPLAEGDTQHLPLSYQGPLGAALVFADPAASDAAELTAIEPSPRRLECDEGLALRFDRLEARAARALHAAGLCRGCRWPLASELLQLAERGLFVYEHRCEAWIAGPYGCPRPPAAPALDLLPELGLRLELASFAEHPLWQPAPELDCERAELGLMHCDGSVS